MAEKYLSFNINDERTGKIAEILANKTCKKILNILAEKDMTETDISNHLKIPLNTVDYNIKNLIEAGFIEESKDYFWSIKGKRIKVFRISNKKIIISPKKSFSGIIASVLAGGIILGGLKTFVNYIANKTVYSAGFQEKLVERTYDAAKSAPEISSGISSAVPETLASDGLQASSGISLFQGVLIWVIVGVVLGFAGFYLYLKFMKGGSNKL